MSNKLIEHESIRQRRYFIIAMAYNCRTNDSMLHPLGPIRMLEMMINSTSGIRLQDVNTLFSNIAANPVGHGVALDFLINRWDDVYA